MTLAERLELIAAMEVTLGAIEEIHKALPQADLKEDIFILNDIVQRMKRQVRGKDDTSERSNGDSSDSVAGDNVRFLWARPENVDEA